MARRVDLVSVKRGLVGVRGGASGSVASRDAASRSAALPMSALSTALPTARSLGRRHLQKHFSCMFRAITRAR